MAFRLGGQGILPNGSAQALTAVIPLDVIGAFGVLFLAAVDGDEVRLETAIGEAGDGAESVAHWES